MASETTGPGGPEEGAAAGKRSGHAQDGSQLQSVVEEQLFIETAKDDQFSEMPGDPRSRAPHRQKPNPATQGAAPASDLLPPGQARETSPEGAPEEPVEGLVLGNSGFPARGN